MYISDPQTWGVKSKRENKLERFEGGEVIIQETEDSETSSPERLLILQGGTP
jgi:hypothetical protein